MLADMTMRRNYEKLKKVAQDRKRKEYSSVEACLRTHSPLIKVTST